MGHRRLHSRHGTKVADLNACLFCAMAVRSSRFLASGTCGEFGWSFRECRTVAEADIEAESYPDACAAFTS